MQVAEHQIVYTLVLDEHGWKVISFDTVGVEGVKR